MEDRAAAGSAHVRNSEPRGEACCSPWWSTFLHARADVAHAAEQPPSCRDYTRVERSCDVEHDARTGRDILHCRETREQFRICSESRVDRLATTSIETREPLLEGHTLWPARSVEAWPLPPAESDATRPAAPRAAQRDPPSASGRLYRPFHALADDGGAASSSSAAAVAAAAAAALGPSGAPVLTPEVGQAVEDILLFADEMQRDLAHHGLMLTRRGDEEQRRRPGLLARLFGARGGWDDMARGEASPGSFTGPHSA